MWLKIQICKQISIHIWICKLLLWIRNQFWSLFQIQCSFFFTHKSLKCFKKTILVHILLILSSTNNFTTIFKSKIACTAIFKILTSLGQVKFITKKFCVYLGYKLLAFFLLGTSCIGIRQSLENSTELQVMFSMVFSTILSKKDMHRAYIKFMTQKKKGVEAERDFIC